LWLNLKKLNPRISQCLSSSVTDDVRAIREYSAGRVPQKHCKCLYFLFGRKLNDDVHVFVPSLARINVIILSTDERMSKAFTRDLRRY
jgi:hypothetical protein